MDAPPYLTWAPTPGVGSSPCVDIFLPFGLWHLILGSFTCGCPPHFTWAPAFNTRLPFCRDAWHSTLGNSHKRILYPTWSLILLRSHPRIWDPLPCLSLDRRPWALPLSGYPLHSAWDLELYAGLPMWEGVPIPILLSSYYACQDGPMWILHPLCVLTFCTRLPHLPLHYWHSPGLVLTLLPGTSLHRCLSHFGPLNSFRTGLLRRGKEVLCP